MNRPDQTDRLREALRRQAEELPATPVTLDDVRDRAAGIRRRRRLGAGAAALAVVAVLAPVGLATLGGDDPGSLRPTDAPGEDATPGTDAAATDTDGVGVLVGGTISHPGGGSLTPDVAGDIATYSRVGDGRWAVVTTDYTRDSDQVSVHVVGGAGSRLATYGSSEGYGLLPSQAHDAVAWIDREGGVQVLSAGSRLPVRVGSAGATDEVTEHQLLDVRGDCTDPTSCRVLVSTYGRDGASTAWLSGDGSEPFLPGVFEQVDDVSPDGRLASGMTSVDELGQRYCYGVHDVEAGSMLWTSCDAGSLRFSADGEHVLGLDPYLDGPNHSLNVVLDAEDGTEVARHEAPLFDEQWESPDSWVSIDGEDGDSARFTVRRHRLDGRSEVLERGVGSETTDAPFRLEAR